MFAQDYSSRANWRLLSLVVVRTSDVNQLINRISGKILGFCIKTFDSKLTRRLQDFSKAKLKIFQKIKEISVFTTKNFLTF